MHVYGSYCSAGVVLQCSMQPGEHGQQCSMQLGEPPLAHWVTCRYTEGLGYCI